MRSLQAVLNEAIECHGRGEFGRAEMLYDRLLAKIPEQWVIPFNLGTLYSQVKRYGLSRLLLEKASELKPDEPGIWGNLGAVYRTEGEIEKARSCYDRALKLAPNDAQILSNMSGLYVNAAQPEKCLYWAERALQASPALAEAGNHKALALLEMGRYEQGWKAYDARLNLPSFHRRDYGVGWWKGEKVERLAVHGEQGLGDEIMFLQCLHGLKDRAEEIAIEVSPRLVKLMQNSLPWAKFYGTHEELMDHFNPHAGIAMGSLPQLNWPPSRKAYLKPTTEYPKSRIGLSWFGGTMLTHEGLRNAPVEDWKTFLELGSCISLQYGPREDEAKVLGIPHDSAGIEDLDRLAAMIKSCDLVITVCNTTVHIAGALGVPAIVLVPAKPAWRYGLKGERMVWYDSPLMVRQNVGESWPDVFERAKAKCADLRLLPRTECAAA